MFSASLEVVLTIAYREAVSRRHAYLTLEHLLYALAHDPEGERILLGCGTDIPRLRKELNEYLDGSIEQVKRGQDLTQGDVDGAIRLAIAQGSLFDYDASAERPSSSGRSKSFAGAVRTTRCSSARRASARRQWPKDWRRA